MASNRGVPAFPTRGIGSSVPRPTMVDHTCDAAGEDGECSVCEEQNCDDPCECSQDECRLCNPSQERDDEDEEEECECDGTSDCECTDCMPIPPPPPPPPPTTRVRPAAKKAAARVHPMAASITDVHAANQELVARLSNLYACQTPEKQRYAEVATSYLLGFIRQRIAAGLYKHLTKPVELALLRKSSNPRHFTSTRDNSTTWNPSSSFYHPRLFGTDALPEYSGRFSIADGQYTDNVDLWVTLFVFCELLRRDSVDINYYVTVPSKYVEWKVAGNVYKVYQFIGTPNDANAQANAEDDEEDEEDYSYGNFSLIHSSDADAVIIQEARCYFLRRHATPLPIILYKEDLESEATAMKAISRYLDSRWRSRFHNTESQKHLFVGGVIIEGVHFDRQGEGYPFKTVTATAESREALDEMINDDELDHNCVPTETEGNDVSNYRFVESPYFDKDVPALPSVNIGRLLMNPCFYSLMASFIELTQPSTLTMEEAIQAAVEKEMEKVTSERAAVVSEIIDARKIVARGQSKIADLDMRIVALSSAMEANYTEAMRRLEPLGYAEVQLLQTGNVLIRTGPLFGNFTEVEHSDKEFYVGDFQIIASVIGSGFILRNVAAPIIAHRGSRTDSLRVNTLIHPHSSTGSSICWGDYSPEFKVRSARGSELPIADDFESRIRTLHMFLTSAGYDDGYVEKWHKALLPSVPGVTAVTGWDTSMNVSNSNIGAGRNSLQGVTRRNFSSKDDFPPGAICERLESEDQLVWSS